MTINETVVTTVKFTVPAGGGGGVAYDARVEYEDTGGPDPTGNAIILSLPYDDPTTGVEIFSLTLTNSELADLGNLLTEVVAEILAKKEAR